MTEQELQAIEERWPKPEPGRWNSEGNERADIHALVAEVRRLQAQQTAQFGRSTARLADVALDAERMAQRVQELERENAELRAKLDAVPVSAVGYIMADIEPVDIGDMQRLYESRVAVSAWLAVQP